MCVKICCLHPSLSLRQIVFWWFVAVHFDGSDQRIFSVTHLAYVWRWTQWILLVWTVHFWKYMYCGWVRCWQLGWDFPTVWSYLTNRSLHQQNSVNSARTNQPICMHRKLFGSSHVFQFREVHLLHNSFKQNDSTMFPFSKSLLKSGSCYTAVGNLWEVLFFQW